MTCDRCRHWIGLKEAECLKYMGEDGVGACALTRSEGNEPLHPQTKAFVVEGDDFHGCLVTRPDFGCNQFEPK